MFFRVTVFFDPKHLPASSSEEGPDPCFSRLLLGPSGRQRAPFPNYFRMLAQKGGFLAVGDANECLSRTTSELFASLLFCVLWAAPFPELLASLLFGFL